MNILLQFTSFKTDDEGIEGLSSIDNFKNQVVSEDLNEFLQDGEHLVGTVRAMIKSRMVGFLCGGELDDVRQGMSYIESGDDDVPLKNADEIAFLDADVVDLGRARGEGNLGTDDEITTGLHRLDDFIEIGRFEGIAIG